MVDALLEILETQENELRFKEVSFSSLHEIGERLLFLAGERGGKVYVQIRVNGDVVYASAMDGTSRNNIAWARRKANTAELAGKSSLRDGLINRAKGRTLSERGLSETDYTEEGGSFPLLLESGVTIGSFTVSGMKSEEDHQLIADVLSEHLGKKIPSVLPCFQISL